MTELFLIAHKVRGEPAFDVAVQMEMPDGVWWIVATSGHRAYPAVFMHLDCVTPEHVEMMKRADVSACRDHYAAHAAPALAGGKITSLSLADLGL
jgi:hypothetical protein